MPTLKPSLLLFVLAAGAFGPPLLAAESRAAKWGQEYERGCDKGQLQDCLNLAVGYARGEFRGKKVDKDPALSQRFANRAIEVGTATCRQGNLKDCYQLGIVYFEGQLVPTDFAKGIEYVRKACVGGYKEACTWLKDTGVQ